MPPHGATVYEPMTVLLIVRAGAAGSRAARVRLLRQTAAGEPLSDNGATRLEEGDFC